MANCQIFCVKKEIARFLATKMANCQIFSMKKRKKDFLKKWNCAIFTTKMPNCKISSRQKCQIDKFPHRDMVNLPDFYNKMPNCQISFSQETNAKLPDFLATKMPNSHIPSRENREIPKFPHRQKWKWQVFKTQFKNYQISLEQKFCLIKSWFVMASYTVFHKYYYIPHWYGYILKIVWLHIHFDMAT